MIPKKIFRNLVVFFFFIPPLGADDFSWKLARDREGIQVYTRHVDASPIHEFRSETVIKVPLEKTLALYGSIERIPEWFFRCIEAKLLEEKPDGAVRIYFAADLPWPLSDRDGVYQRVQSVDPGTGAVSFKLSNAEEGYPRHKGRVRVRYIDSEWRFTPLPDGTTAVYYRMHIEAGGLIPVGVINRFTVSLPFKSLRKFRSLLEAS